MAVGKKICFQILDAYSLFNTNTMHPFGGAEFRAVIFLRELQKKSLDVSAIVRGYGQTEKENYEGVTVWAHPYHTLTQPARNLTKRLLSGKLSGNSYEKHLKYHIYKKINADIFCAFEITTASLMLCEYCKENNKAFYLFIASDGEVDKSNASATQAIFHKNEELSEKIINSASAIFVQNQIQLTNLQKNYGKKGILIKNPIPLDSSEREIKKEYDFLWVGKSNRIKRPLLYKKLAAALPAYRFCMVMNTSDKNIETEVLEHKTPNLDIKGFVNSKEMEALFQKSKIFVSTSLLEGFPNTFLQAAKHKLPLLSTLINPDHFLNEYNCGICTGDSESELVKAAELLIKDEALQKKMGENAAVYVKLNHDSSKIIEQVTQYFC